MLERTGKTKVTADLPHGPEIAFSGCQDNGFRYFNGRDGDARVLRPGDLMIIAMDKAVRFVLEERR